MNPLKLSNDGNVWRLVGTFGSYYFVDVSEAISLRDQLLAAFPIEAPKPVDDTVPMRRLTKEEAKSLMACIRYIQRHEEPVPSFSQVLNLVCKALTGEEP